MAAPDIVTRNLEEDLKRTKIAQGRAADPSASVWVSANAGTGKTHVLTMRVLRLMLAGTAPERILCLTYTKAAAAEMSKRVFDTLAQWVVQPERELQKTLAELLRRAPTPTETAHARTLFARATETPGGLSVQTLHAFSERLLQRFPLEAGITPGFVILDEETAGALLKDSINDVIGHAAQQPTSALGAALASVIAYAVEDQFDDILAGALRHYHWIESAVRMPADKDGGTEGLDRTRALYENYFGVRPGVSISTIKAELADTLSEEELIQARDVLRTGKATDVKRGEELDLALRAATVDARYDALSSFFLKSDGSAREKFLTKGLDDEHPALTPLLQRAGERFLKLSTELKGAEVTQATMALLLLAAAILQRYRDAKVRRAALDFDDLILRAEMLLATRDNAEWVLFKLDNGIDHILVDESQDTSPAQWNIVKALTGEFFSSEDTPRTVFAVGDEKQSIYSFQGAAPRMFEEAGQHFETSVTAAGRKWKRIPLDLSFRTVEPVLHAVDYVFGDRRRAPGVGTADEIRHIAKRFDQAGLVEVWPTETHEDSELNDAWSPFDEESAQPPVLRLANRIADTIKHWLANGEQLHSNNRPIRPGDILILVRKRAPLVTPMVQALKARGIPVAGADRMHLTEQIAVQDVLSLCEFLVLPEDDLSLAEVLKSPIFGLDDDDLLTLAHGRKGTLWKALLELETRGGKFAAAATSLKRWRKQADFRPPYEFLADMLDRDNVRAKLISRLGPDAADPLDELLNLALTFDDGAPPSLSGFLAAMRDGERMIKRDMEHGRNEVRVMTVHGSKGLEAPIVFLPDTCSSPFSGQQGNPPILIEDMPWPDTQGSPVVWPVKGTSGLSQIRSARETMRLADRDEYNRLLYVAMTRARDRLYIAGFERKQKPHSACWYRLVVDALEGHLENTSGALGQTVQRLSSEQTGPADASIQEVDGLLNSAPLPLWAAQNAPAEAQLTIPLAPSRFAPYEMDDEGEPLALPTPPDPMAPGPSFSPGSADGESRFQRGLLTHALLEHLPTLPPERWADAAAGFLAARAPTLPQGTAAQIVSETCRVLDDAGFAPVFGAGSRAEVPIVAVIERPMGEGAPLRITGQLDRLVVLPDRILIVDFKTNRAAPSQIGDVAKAYLYQLAAYRMAVQRIYPDLPVEAALLWTAEARLMPVPGEVLDQSEEELWRINPASLDG